MRPVSIGAQKQNYVKTKTNAKIGTQFIENFCVNVNKVMICPQTSSSSDIQRQLKPHAT